VNNTLQQQIEDKKRMQEEAKRKEEELDQLMEEKIERERREQQDKYEAEQREKKVKADQKLMEQEAEAKRLEREGARRVEEEAEKRDQLRLERERKEIAEGRPQQINASAMQQREQQWSAQKQQQSSNPDDIAGNHDKIPRTPIGGDRPQAQKLDWLQQEQPTQQQDHQQPPPQHQPNRSALRNLFGDTDEADKPATQADPRIAEQKAEQQKAEQAEREERIRREAYEQGNRDAREEVRRIEAEAEAARQRHDQAKVKWAHASTSAVDWQQKKDAEMAAEAARIELERMQALAAGGRRRQMEAAARHELEEAQKAQYETQIERASHARLHVSTRWGAGISGEQAAVRSLELECEQAAQLEVEQKEAEAAAARQQLEHANGRLEDAKKRAVDWKELKKMESEAKYAKDEAGEKHAEVQAARLRYDVAHSAVLALTTSHAHLESMQLEVRHKDALAEAAEQDHNQAVSRLKDSMANGVDPKEQQVAKSSAEAARAELERARAEAAEFKKHLGKLRAVGAKKGRQLAAFGLPTSLSDSAIDVGSSLTGASKLVFADGSTMQVGYQDANVADTSAGSPAEGLPTAQPMPPMSPMPKAGRSTADALTDMPLDPVSARSFNHLHETYMPNFGFTKQHISAVLSAPDMSAAEYSHTRAAALPSRITNGGETHVGSGADVAKLLDLNLRKLDLLEAMNFDNEQGDGSDDSTKQLEIDSEQLSQLLLRLVELGRDEPELGGDTRWVHDTELSSLELGSALIGGLVSGQRL
jgi:hypothetical protein